MRYSGSSRSVIIGAACLVSIAAGCNRQSGPIEPPRTPTIPVIGKVHVDGKPQLAVGVFANPLGDTKKPEEVHVTSFGGYTDAEGNFKIGTYELGDGLPVGEYALTFMWAEKNLFTGRKGPDKLASRFGDPAKSEHKLTVEAGSTVVDVGVIELTTK